MYYLKNFFISNNNLQKQNILLLKKRRDDVADERRKNALESKKKAFMDAQEMMEALVKLDQRMKGEQITEVDNKDNHFKGGAAEKFAK